jgi:hypothetical protein
VIGDSKVPFVVSGNEDNMHALKDYDYLIRISSPQDFIEQLDHFYHNGERARAGDAAHKK